MDSYHGFRYLAGLAAGCAVLASAGCAAAQAGPARTGTAHTSSAHSGLAATSAPPAGSPGCPPPPPRHAWAVEVSATGHVIWQTSLPTHGEVAFSTVQPVIVGAVAVFAQDGVVHGLRLAGGHQVWSRALGQSVYGMWSGPGLVVVLTDQVSDHARLTGLDAATGAVRWALAVPGSGLLGNLAPTSDGGLAMVRTNGVLQVVSLADGRVRWSRRTGASPALAAADGLVLFGVDGRVTGYDDMTGAARWTVRGLPGQPDLTAAGGLVLVTSNVQGPGQPTALTAIAPRAGRVAWRFDPGVPVSVLAAGPPAAPAGLAVATANPDRLYLLNVATGRPRWQAATQATESSPLITAADLVGEEGYGPVRLVDRDASTGRIRWQHPVSALPGQRVVSVGQLALLPEVPAPGRPARPAPLLAYRMAGGSVAWRATMPTFVTGAPVPVPGAAAVLVQASDLGYACAAAGSVVGSVSR